MATCYTLHLHPTHEINADTKTNVQNTIYMMNLGKRSKQKRNLIQSHVKMADSLRLLENEVDLLVVLIGSIKSRRICSVRAVREETGT